MRGEPQEVCIQHQLAHAAVRQHDRPHLIEQQLLRYTAEPPEGALKPFDQHRYRLPAVKPQSQQPRVAQNHHQAHGAGPREA